MSGSHSGFAGSACLGSGPKSSIDLGLNSISEKKRATTQKSIDLVTGLVDHVFHVMPVILYEQTNKIRGVEL